MIYVAVVLTIFVYGMIAAMLGTILPDLSKRFSLTPSQNGNIALAQAVGLIIASISVGPLIDNEGKKVGVVLGLALIALALFLLPKSKSYGQVALYMLVLGLGGGIIVTGANAVVGDMGGAALFNFINLFFGLGGLATPFISANLLGSNSQKLCYLTAILTLVGLAAFAAAPIAGPTGERGFQFSQAGELFGSPVLWLLSLLLFLYVACEVGVWNWLARHLIAQGIPESRALNILSLGFALGLLIGRMAVAPLFGTLTPATVTLLASVLMTVTTFMALRTKHPTVAWVTVFFAGIAMAPVFPTTLAMVNGAFKVGTATAIGIVVTFGWIGLAVSSRIIGAVAGSDPKKLRSALLLIPAASAGMIAVTLALRPLLP